ncbi:hypothetical protein HDU76_010633 [Blyttiomyces sp. JEL0837]|nr:hypothetical protein HDU76_010633 [Blyttiomyces sp. JEL0837]
MAANSTASASTSSASPVHRLHITSGQHQHYPFLFYGPIFPPENAKSKKPKDPLDNTFRMFRHHQRLMSRHERLQAESSNNPSSESRRFVSTTPPDIYSTKSIDTNLYLIEQVRRWHEDNIDKVQKHRVAANKGLQNNETELLTKIRSKRGLCNTFLHTLKKYIEKFEVIRRSYRAWNDTVSQKLEDLDTAFVHFGSTFLQDQVSLIEQHYVSIRNEGAKIQHSIQSDANAILFDTINNINMNIVTFESGINKLDELAKEAIAMAVSIEGEIHQYYEELELYSQSFIMAVRRASTHCDIDAVGSEYDDEIERRCVNGTRHAHQKMDDWFQLNLSGVFKKHSSDIFIVGHAVMEELNVAERKKNDCECRVETFGKRQAYLLAALGGAAACGTQVPNQSQQQKKKRASTSNLSQDQSPGQRANNLSNQDS